MVTEIQIYFKIYQRYRNTICNGGDRNIGCLLWNEIVSFIFMRTAAILSHHRSQITKDDFQPQGFLRNKQRQISKKQTGHSRKVYI